MACGNGRISDAIYAILAEDKRGWTARPSPNRPPQLSSYLALRAELRGTIIIDSDLCHCSESLRNFCTHQVGSFHQRRKKEFAPANDHGTTGEALPLMLNQRVARVIVREQC